MALEAGHRLNIAIVALIGTTLSGCCSAPRVVSNVTSQHDHLLLLQTDQCSGETVVVECVVNPHGSAEHCRRTPLVFRD